MEEKMTWQEIRDRFPDEWVVLVDYEVSGIEPTKGVVAYHGKVKREVYQNSREIAGKAALVYTGEIRHGLIGLFDETLDKPNSKKR